MRDFTQNTRFQNGPTGRSGNVRAVLTSFMGILIVILSGPSRATTTDLRCEIQSETVFGVEGHFTGHTYKPSENKVISISIIDGRWLNQDQISNIIYSKSGNSISYELMGNAHLKYPSYFKYKLDSITGLLTVRVRVKLASSANKAYYPDLDENGYATINQNIYQCVKSDRLF